MPLTKAEIEEPRTPSELRNFVEHVRSLVRENSAEFKAGMAKRGFYKEFLDEIVPLCNFSEVAYPANYKVKPVLGNQGFDAIVFDAQGNEVDKIELAKPYDGAAAAENARQVVARGYGDMKICSFTEVLNEFARYFKDTSKDKSLKDYTGITLVFILSAPPPLEGIEESYKQQVEKLKAIIAKRDFKAKQVLLFVPPGEVHKIYR